MLPAAPWIIEPARALELAKELGDTPDELLIDLITIAQSLAQPPISKYRVGEAGRATTGRIYLGINVELVGHPLFQTIHGEQFVIAAMLLGGEVGVEAISMPAAPCGHCRQFMWEVAGADKLLIVNPNRPIDQSLAQLLPFPFGPKDLGVEGALLAHRTVDVRLPEKLSLPRKHRAEWEMLAQSALKAARRSYAPYSGPAGMALQTKSGLVALGPYIDNAAFNPSLPSLQVALVSLIQQGARLEDVQRVVLVERPGDLKSQRLSTESVLKTLAPDAEMVTLALE